MRRAAYQAVLWCGGAVTVLLAAAAASQQQRRRQQPYQAFFHGKPSLSGRLSAIPAMFSIYCSLPKKPRRVCRPQAANKVQSVFCGGVYVAKNTSQSASVEFVRLWRTNYARGRLQFLSKKAGLFLIFTSTWRRAAAGRPALCAAGAGAPSPPGLPAGTFP